MSGYVDIQFQDISGNWVTVASTINQDQQVAARLNDVQRAYDGKRVRAVDSSTGAIVDIR